MGGWIESAEGGDWYAGEGACEVGMLKEWWLLVGVGADTCDTDDKEPGASIRVSVSVRLAVDAMD